MTENSGGQPGGWGQGGGYGGFYAPPAGGAAPVGPSSGGPSGSVDPAEAIAFGWRLVFADYARTALPIVVAFVAYYAAAGVVGLAEGAIAKVIGTSLGVYTEPRLQPVTDPSQFSRLWIQLMRAQLPLFAIELPMNLLVGAVAGALFFPGIAGFSLRTARGERPDFAEVFTGMGKHFVPMLVAGLLLQLVSFLAVAACFVPWFIVMPGLSMYVFCIIDRNQGGPGALRDSWHLTRGNKFKIFLFFVLGSLLSLAATLACCLPFLLVAVPVLMLGLAQVYASLTGQLPANAAMR